MAERGTEPSDEALVAAFRSGDRSAFGLLVQRHERRVYNLALRMTGREEDARDATQDAFLSAMRKLGSFRGEAAFTTWMHRVAVNACYDLLRKRQRSPLLDASREDRPEPEPRPSPDPSEAADLAIDVRRALLQVPEDYRVAMILHDVQDLPYEEVARILGIPIGTVRSRLHRGRVALARAMGIAPSPEAAAPEARAAEVEDREAAGVEARERPDAPEPSDGTVPR